ncbi:MAG: hypothetical protein M3273_09035 [Actinomycetota bacterium]|nr:hypothetical protein [Actinomycetota bacterium]
MAAAGLAATLLGACSGDPKEEFIAAADDVCREADEAISELSPAKDAEGIAAFLERAEEISQRLVSRLRDLEPPEGDADVIDRMIDAIERATDQLEPLAAAATAGGGPQELGRLQRRALRATDEVNRIARSYGFEACGSKVFAPRS